VICEVTEKFTDGELFTLRRNSLFTAWLDNINTDQQEGCSYVGCTMYDVSSDVTTQQNTTQHKPHHPYIALTLMGIMQRLRN
jgi:hypothetical protein